MWHKWDFHVHTPYSVLNNGFGINPYEDSDFDKYVRELFVQAISKGVSAIGITDYFSIEGYKRIKNDYLQCDDALARVFPDSEERSAIKKILVFPNIEFRTNEFIGKKSHPLNYHVLFSDKVPLEVIEQYFLQELHIIIGTEERRPLSRQSLADLGKISASGRGDSTGDYYALGLKLATIDRREVRKVLEGCGEFRNRYLIAVPVDEDLSKVDWEGRDYPTRREIYHECDCLLTPNAGTRRWALAEGEEGKRIEEFGSIMPCIWGSDAHDFKSLFEPAGYRYCWLKADVSFEGLRQILFEPESRVRIQRESPRRTDQHRIIDSIQVRDLRLGAGERSAFQSNPVVFSEGLTCIIGGKSTGKSLLLRTLAHAIDDEYAKRQEAAAGIPALPQMPDVEVAWADNASGRRRFIYIPQAYLNRLVDDPQRRTQTDELIENFLLQDEARKAAHDEMDSKLKAIKGEAFVTIQEYRDLRGKRDEFRRLLDRDGSSLIFATTIEKLEAERDTIAKESHVTEDEVLRYEELGLSIDRLVEEKAVLDEDWHIIRDMPSPVAVIPGHTILQDDKPKHSFAGMSAASVKRVEDELEKERITLEALWDEARTEILDDLELASASNRAEIAKLDAERTPLREKVEQSVRLRDTTSRLDEERRKEAEAREREVTIEHYEDRMSVLKNKLLCVWYEMLSAIESYCSVVNSSVEERSELEFSARPVWRRDDFVSAFLGQVDNRSLSQFRQATGVDLRELHEDDLNADLFSKLWIALENPSDTGGIPTKTSHSFWSVIQLLVDNWYNVHYVVRSGDDEMDSMSPGKKSLVLLELIIDLDKEMCPLLIDQPEDDLDNRSVYNDLVAYIRRRKTDRQIIVVTHNANIVLGTDAEEVIVANQEGIGTPNASRRFEYRSGAIENDDVEVGTSRGILYERGLQAQMCDILEGGPEALERRRRKYTSQSLEWAL